MILYLEKINHSFKITEDKVKSIQVIWNRQGLSINVLVQNKYKELIVGSREYCHIKKWLLKANLISEF